MKKLMTVAFSVMATCLFAGNTYYADASVEASGDGLTPETAKKTIQEAVDLCATSGDTVKVAEGVYQDTNTCTYDSARAVVVITNKIHLVATGAKEKTIIKGAFDSTSGNVGPDAVRGVYVYYTGSGTAGKRTANSIIEGFTVCNGATGTGGAGGGMSIQNSYAVCCIVSNCVAKNGGAFCRGTAVRCLVTDCTSTAHGVVSMSTTYLNSIIVRNDGGQRLFYYPGMVVNCTVSGNNFFRDWGYFDSSPSLFNTIFADNTGWGVNDVGFYSYSPVASNCVFKGTTRGLDLAKVGSIHTNTSDYAYAAPALGDWRTTAEMGAGDVGNAEYLKKITLPTELEDHRYLDYYGKPIPKTGAITCGAVQEVCPAKGGLLKFDGNTGWEIDGFGELSSTWPALNYIWTDDYPGMFKVRKAGATLTTLFGYSMTANGATFLDPIDPTLDNWAGIVPCPGKTNLIQRVSPTNVLYVDAAAETDEGADGKVGNPYATIQAAVNAAPNNSSRRTVILVRKGEYRPTGTQNCTVHVYNKTPGTTGDWWYKKLRIVAEEGPEKTFIFGAKGEGEDGFGAGAATCCHIEYPSMVQGFTLTGGYGDKGAAAIGNAASNARYLDCVITNNHGKSAIVYTAQIVRCRIADNVVTTGSSTQPFYGDITGSTADNRVKAYACEIVHSASSVANSHAVARFADIAFCSIVGTCAGNTYFGSILPGGAGKVQGSANMCFAHGEPFTGSATDCKNGKSRCLRYARGDFRLRDDSPCLGMVTVDPEADRNYLTLDMDGNPLKLDSLAGNTAGAHQMWSVHYEPQGFLMFIR